MGRRLLLGTMALALLAAGCSSDGDHDDLRVAVSVVAEMPRRVKTVLHPDGVSTLVVERTDEADRLIAHHPDGTRTTLRTGLRIRVEGFAAGGIVIWSENRSLVRMSSMDRSRRAVLWKGDGFNGVVSNGTSRHVYVVEQAGRGHRLHLRDTALEDPATGGARRVVPTAGPKNARRLVGDRLLLGVTNRRLLAIDVDGSRERRRAVAARQVMAASPDRIVYLVPDGDTLAIESWQPAAGTTQVALAGAADQRPQHVDLAGSALVVWTADGALEVHEGQEWRTLSEDTGAWQMLDDAVSWIDGGDMWIWRPGGEPELVATDADITTTRNGFLVHHGGQLLLMDKGGVVTEAPRGVQGIVGSTPFGMVVLFGRTDGEPAQPRAIHSLPTAVMLARPEGDLIVLNNELAAGQFIRSVKVVGNSVYYAVGAVDEDDRPTDFNQVLRARIRSND